MKLPVDLVAMVFQYLTMTTQLTIISRLNRLCAGLVENHPFLLQNITFNLQTPLLLSTVSELFHRSGNRLRTVNVLQLGDEVDYNHMITHVVASKSITKITFSGHVSDQLVDRFHTALSKQLVVVFQICSCHIGKFIKGI